MESQKSKSKPIEEQSMIKVNEAQDYFSHGELKQIDEKINANFNGGELLLTAEKTSLTEEIKILIRKLWN